MGIGRLAPVYAGNNPGDSIHICLWSLSRTEGRGPSGGLHHPHSLALGCSNFIDRASVLSNHTTNISWALQAALSNVLDYNTKFAKHCKIGLQVMERMSCYNLSSHLSTRHALIGRHKAYYKVNTHSGHPMDLQEARGSFFFPPDTFFLPPSWSVRAICFFLFPPTSELFISYQHRLVKFERGDTTLQ